MDREVLRLFGIIGGEDKQEQEPIPTEYVPGNYLNGRLLLKRWSLCVKQRVGRFDTKDLRVTVTDELTGRIKIWNQKVKRIWQDVEDKSMHCDLLYVEIPGDWFELYQQTGYEIEVDRELHLRQSLGAMGDHAYRLCDFNDGRELEVKEHGEEHQA